MNITASMIKTQITKGKFTPHTALTNIALSYYQNASNYFAKAIFPVCRVSQSSDQYYIFSKEDLLRDNWQKKPAHGKVMPSVLSERTDTYRVTVEQSIMGIDQIRETELTRRQGPAIARDPRQQIAKAIAEQANIHQDRLFANKFFVPGVWANEMTGTDETNPTGNQFIKFSNGNSDPIKFIADKKKDMHQQTGRTPNKIAIGANVFSALCNHPAILERVKYGGATANPASVTKNVLAQLFEIDELVVLMSIYNQAKPGAEADMQFIGDPNALLLAYATNSPSIDEPSAGYIFSWDMLGDGNILPMFYHDGEWGTHSDYVEGLMAFDMKKTADDLAIFCKDVV